MNADDYQRQALALSSEQGMHDRLLMGALGLNGESGEVADHLKKHLFQGHDLDKAFLAKELGDIAWYLAVAADGIDMSLSDVLALNLAKLNRRYPAGFTAESSRNRDDE